MKSLLKISLFIACLGCTATITAQDIHLSQFSETPILRNPALIGIFNGDVRVQAVYRNQWNSVTIPYETGTISGELKYPVGTTDFVTVGLQLTYDRAGTSKLQSTQVFPAFNYHKSLSDDKSTFLSLGAMGGLVQRQFDITHLTFDNQYTNGRFDPTASTGEDGRLSLRGYTYLDAGVGLSFNSVIGENTNYYIGAALYHFNRPKVSFMGDKSIQLQAKITFNAGITIPVSENVKVIAQYNELHQGSYSEFIGGAMIGYGLLSQGLESDHGVYGGVYYRYGDAIIPMVRLDMGKYEIGFSYDSNISSLTPASHGQGGFEISLVFKAFRNEDVANMACPRF
ncbi:type IX secretion system membrane protein, PorP/SprF family [Chitinophaga costaii]|uniref:Type IX secretion system membrane protein, PorP/SprF family n=1 Tax=Chitinophaga costaii TaxID=1335309 RepID=A0A1C4BZQ2_9BACT|nr:PorP/SprF family type IX secretion system membrane protein [Chitinophaga costaii]PUZ27401.1 type IX secretion system membrane protein PorP/SprF [Chitinophaga costaii]SCC12359.1 type IX secretion system membrane protein, PorP/SprF family [Chitinophaga costaii]